MRLIVVGARGATRELLRRLGERWEVTVVDPDIENLPDDVGRRRLLGRS